MTDVPVVMVIRPFGGGLVGAGSYAVGRMVAVAQTRSHPQDGREGDDSSCADQHQGISERWYRLTLAPAI